MIFTAPKFFLFFAIVWSVYWILGSDRRRRIFIVLSSYVFYASWDYRFLSLLVASTVVDWALGQKLSRPMPAGHKRRWVAVSVALNLGFLGVFKYYDFFATSLSAALGRAGVACSPPLLGVVLPAGISFYTFMSMSYTIDVARGEQPAKSFWDFAFFVSFFPHLVAGPILRASKFLPQLDAPRQWRDVDARAALLVFLVGYVKKAVVADNLAPVVDRYFAAPGAFDAKAAWIAVLCYAAQIYGDFSGYSDMAMGTARLLGYELCDNFDAPYLAPSFTAFWRRWHMSLSTWLRDYLYIPLGGSRKGEARTYVNLFTTMLLGGLWHGAAWHFVAWGGLHGAALAAERALRVDHAEPPKGLRAAAKIAVTFVGVCLAWIFFRATSFAHALTALRACVTLRSPGAQTFPALFFGLLAALVVAHVAARRARVGAWMKALPAPVFGLVYGVLFGLAVACVPAEPKPFIYFQF